MERVTIGIPTYNRAESFARALASAKAQDYPEIEILVSDNASTDHTPAVTALLSAVDPRVQVMRQRRNIGMEANFRAVLEAATGEYFMWLADDDWMEPNYVGECIAFLLAHPDYSLVAGRTTFYGTEGTAPFEGSVTVLEQHRPEDRVCAFYRTVHEAAVFYGVARRAMWLSIPMEKRIGSDWHMIGALAATGKIMTIETARIHRSADGISKASSALAAYYGLTGAGATNVHLVITRDVVGEILWRRAPYRALPLWRRLKLALHTYLAMYERWGLTQWSRQPSILRRIELKLHWWAVKWLRRPAIR